MIRIYHHRRELASYPTLRAVAYFVEDTPDLWRYEFIRDGVRRVSWTEVEREIQKLKVLYQKSCK